MGVHVSQNVKNMVFLFFFFFFFLYEYGLSDIDTTGKFLIISVLYQVNSKLQISYSVDRYTY